MDLVKVNEVVSAAIVDLSPSSKNQNIKVQRSKLNDLNCIEVDPKLSNIISNVEGKELYLSLIHI